MREVSEERPTYPSSDYESTNLQLAIQNPNTFYFAPSSSYPVVDWLTDDAQRQNHDLWGGVSGYKTKYDPCPEGWKVPAAGAPWGFRKEYKKAGALNDAQPYDSTYPWFIEYDDAYCIGFRYKQADSGKEYWFPFAGRKEVSTGVLNGGGRRGYFPHRDLSEHVRHHGDARMGQSGQRDGSQPSLWFFGSLHQGVMTAPEA